MYNSQLPTDGGTAPLHTTLGPRLFDPRTEKTAMSVFAWCSRALGCAPV